MLVRLKDCVVTLIYLNCKCSSPLHYNDICLPHIQCPVVPSHKLDYCLWWMFAGKLPIPVPPGTPSVLPSALLTHDDGLWTMKETHLLKRVSFVHWRIFLCSYKFLILIQCFISCISRGARLAPQMLSDLWINPNPQGPRRGRSGRHTEISADTKKYSGCPDYIYFLECVFVLFRDAHILKALMD